MDRNGTSVGWGLVGVRRPTSVSRVENKVSLREVLPEVDMELSSLADGLKEDLILRSPGAQQAFTFPLTLSGLSATLDEGGDLVFTDAAGVEAARTPAGWMQDSSADSASQAGGVISEAVAYALVPHRGGQALQVTLDDTWLDDPARVFPVRVDPSYLWYQPESSPDDTYVATTPSGDRSQQANLSIGHRSGDPSGRTRRSYLHFNVGSGYQVTAAQLKLHATVDPECRSTRIDVHRVTSYWTGSSMTTWPGASYRFTVDASTYPYNYGSPRCTTGGNNTLSSTALATTVKGWVDGTIANHGLMVKAFDESNAATASYREFYSYQGGAPNSLQRPYLEVFYNGEPRTPTELTPVPEATTSTTPTLSAIYRDLDGDSGRVDLYVYNNATGALVASGGGSIVSSGSRSSGSCPPASWKRERPTSGGPVPETTWPLYSPYTSYQTFTAAASPGAPTNVGANPGDEQAQVSWSPSAANGSPVTGL